MKCCFFLTFLAYFFVISAENIDDYDEEADVEPEPEPEHKTLAEMLNTGDDDDYYGYEEDY